MGTLSGEIHDIELLLPDLVQDSPSHTADQRQRELFGSQQEKIDVPAPLLVIGPRSEKIAIGLGYHLGHAPQDRLLDGLRKPHWKIIPQFSSTNKPPFPWSKGCLASMSVER